jgi:hypothetical protein
MRMHRARHSSSSEFPRDLLSAFVWAAVAAMAICWLWFILLFVGAAWARDPGQGAPDTTTVPKDHIFPGGARLWLVGGDVPEDLYPDNGGGVPFEVPPGALVLPGVPKPGPYGDGYGPTTPPPGRCDPMCYPPPYSPPEYIPPPTYPPNDRYGNDTPPPADTEGPFTYGRRGFSFDGPSVHVRVQP